MPDKIPLTYTFGNHMHWVDMEWLWGYHVLPGSVADMLAYCRETGARGCVNFDGIGYEKMAAEAPEALQALREAVAAGTIEPVGCSYGQPYGLFHGGESNVRQRVYGVRTVMRLLGTRPRTFWEEEFDFFPQLPQMLAGVGMTGASLYFQWTWHTPEVPFEASPVVWWEGQDGTRILTATRNRLNLHQWPEDFQILLDELAEFGPAEALARPLAPSEAKGPGSPPPTPSSCSGHEPSPAREEGAGPGSPPPTPSSCSEHEPSPAHEEGAPDPLVLQWLELMPSPDWMCRAEVMVPKLQELKKDQRFEVAFATLGEYLERQRSRASSVPVRQYRLDDVWHGMTLGKNGDHMRRASAKAERELLNAEFMASFASLFGRPYAQWDVYPVWELEEAWRELLSAQHHDNDECEGLCGRIGKLQYGRAQAIAEETIVRTTKAFGLGRDMGWRRTVSFNPFGWKVPSRDGSRNLAPFSFFQAENEPRPCGQIFDKESGTMTPADGETQIDFIVDLKRGVVTSLKMLEGPECVPSGSSLGQLSIAGTPLTEYGSSFQDIDEQYVWAHYGTKGEPLWNMEFQRSHRHAGLDLTFEDIDGLIGRIEPGFKGALIMAFPSAWPEFEVHADSPYAVQTVGLGSRGRRKYPTGDWMTSPQWFEEVEGAFTSHSLVDIVDPTSGFGLLIVHSGFMQWFRVPEGVTCVIAANDPWDEGYFRNRSWEHGEAFDQWRLDGSFGLVPHGPVTNHERWQTAQEFRRGQQFLSSFLDSGCRLPVGFSMLDCRPGNILVTALYRESEDCSGRDLESYAGRGMGYPYVLRLVEFDGIESEVDLNIAGPVAKAFKTNLLGEIERELVAERGDDSLLTSETEALRPFGIEAARLTFKMRPYEIATLYLDIVPGRKQFRDLDAKRKVWATVHR